MWNADWTADARRPIVRYGAAVGFTAAGMVANFFLADASSADRYFIFAAAVLGTALCSGFVPGLIVTFVSALALSFFFLTPVHDFHIYRSRDVERLLFFLIEGCLISYVGDLKRRTPALRARSVTFRYSIALGLAVAAAGIKFLAFPNVARQLPFAFCYAVAAGSAWAAGVGPALATTAISAIAAFLFMPGPAFAFSNHRLMMFVLEATLISLLCGGYRATLVRTESYLQQIFFDCPAGILIVAPDLQIVRANPAVQAILQVKESEIERTSLMQLVHPASRESLMAQLTDSSEQPHRGPSACEVRFLQHGDSVWVEFHAAAIKLSRSHRQSWLVMVQDITERRNAEQLLSETEARLHQAQKMEAVGVLASSIAHDFNNQLAVILGYSEEMVTKRSSDELVRRGAQEISRSARKTAEFVQHLLAYTRREGPRLQPVNVNAIVLDCKLFLSRLLGEHIDLITHLDDSVVPVLADQARIEQTLLNLSANAKDAMPAGGKLILRTSNFVLSEPLRIMDRNVPPGQYIKLEVSDCGHGMDPEVLRRIFEPFFTTKPRDKGTGLGLATVERTVRQLNGYILANSTPGQGTEFMVFLPIAKVAAEGVNQPASEPRHEGGRETVLVVEDEESLRRLMAMVLGSAGYRTYEAAGPEQALTIAATLAGQLDLLLTDIRLPGLQGTDLAKEIRARQPHVRVLYVSGDLATVQIPPEDATLAKPFTLEALISRVRQVLDAGAGAATP